MNIEANQHVFEFLRELSPSLVALNRKTNTPNTFIASPHLSSCVGVDIFDNAFYLGFPSDLFDRLYTLRMYSISYSERLPSFYIVFDTYTDNKMTSQPMAVKFYMRQEQVKALSAFKKVNLVRIRDDGTFSRKKGDHIILPLRRIERLEWEK